MIMVKQSRNTLIMMLFAALLCSMETWAAQGVGLTRHNLSISGPGPVKSKGVTQVCVFCHTPHKTPGGMKGAALWGHKPSVQTYDIYGSSTLDALPGQPTGKSILCLSCHDGTVAIGALKKKPHPGKATDAMLNKPINPASRGNLGTDLSDDHPISFIYDSMLAINDGQLLDPSQIKPLQLEDGKVECTTCHDPHEKDIQPFLRVSTLYGQLCTTCHNMAGWTLSSHATSTATWNKIGISPWANRREAWQGANVAQNSCLNCHTPHTAGTPIRLQKAAEENTCYSCHNGNTARTDIETDSSKIFAHPVAITPNPNHDAESLEDPLSMSPHAECADCHNPHRVQNAPPMISFNPFNLSATHTTPPLANALISGVKGVDINGNTVNSVTNQYELCFKCHGLPGKGPCGSLIADDRCSTATSHQMTRQDGIYNIRDKFDPNSTGLVSWHPIASNNPANNTEVPSLRTDVPLNKINSLIYCTDCHNSDTSAAAGGIGANGPHGSNHEGLLAMPYTLDPIMSSSPSSNYALCFKCHSEAALMIAPVSGFSHDRHVGGQNKSCVNCHDPHGSHRNNHLINFQTFSSYTVNSYQILPNNLAEPTFQDGGRYTGVCDLACHGVAHDPASMNY